jgi:predicted DNA-binding transcriptional regulator AlpA
MTVRAICQADYDPIIRPAKVARILGISKSTLWRWRRKPGFPAAVRLGETMVGWRHSEIQAWIDDLPRAPLRTS